MITRTEAEMQAAQLVLESIRRLEYCCPAGAAGAIEAELRKIETWLRRRALGGDKIAIRQAERELGRQVRGPK